MMIREVIKINAPVETVWQVFTETGNWSDWNTVCRDCRLENGEAMAKGGCLSFALSPFIFPVRIAPVIERFIEGKIVTWSGSKWGIHARHTFLFKRVDDWTSLESVETFSGPMLWPARVAGVQTRLHELTKKLLSAIKTEAEGRAKNRNKDKAIAYETHGKM